MKKIIKERVILLGVVVIAVLLLVLLVKKIPVRTFYYQTSPACNSNLYGGGNTEHLKYSALSGGVGRFNDEKSKLEALNIPQSGCSGSGLAPKDFTKLELYLL